MKSNARKELPDFLESLKARGLEPEPTTWCPSGIGRQLRGGEVGVVVREGAVFAFEGPTKHMDETMSVQVWRKKTAASA